MERPMLSDLPVGFIDVWFSIVFIDAQMIRANSIIPEVSTLIMSNQKWNIVWNDRKSRRLVGRMKVETSVTMNTEFQY